MRFFKLEDIDTIIESGEKEHQTSISSVLKRLGDHSFWFWDSYQYLVFWPPDSHFGKESPTEAKNRGVRSIFHDFSKSNQVTTKLFKDRTNISLMCLFPWFDCGNDILKFEKSHFSAAWVILGDFSPLHGNLLHQGLWVNPLFILVE